MFFACILQIYNLDWALFRFCLMSFVEAVCAFQMLRAYIINNFLRVYCGMMNYFSIFKRHLVGFFSPGTLFEFV